jgi:hypothetical protein
MSHHVPTSGKAELHITYRCNLQCVNCNRFSQIENHHTPDMTLDDVNEFFRQCRELNWNPDILIIGGEPTMNTHFLDIIAAARKFKGNGLVQVWTNGRDRTLVQHIRERYNASVPEETFKAKSRIDFQWDDYYISPADYGIDRYKCWQHASEICGISVDANGYMPCAVGGMIDGVLKLGLRTKRLADLFDEQKNAALTKEMCKHCGACLTNLLNGKEKQDWRDYVESQAKRFGSHMSPTWYKATEGVK